MTAKQLEVMQAFANCPDGGGARIVVNVFGWRSRGRYLVAGGYAARLVRKGWLHRERDTWLDNKGRYRYTCTRYHVTAQGRQAMQQQQGGQS